VDTTARITEIYAHVAIAIAGTSNGKKCSLAVDADISQSSMSTPPSSRVALRANVERGQALAILGASTAGTTPIFMVVVKRIAKPADVNAKSWQ
jgi:hypothetical protein